MLLLKTAIEAIITVSTMPVGPRTRYNTGIMTELGNLPVAVRNRYGTGPGPCNGNGPHRYRCQYQL
jgi:hypothetical protein